MGPTAQTFCEFAPPPVALMCRSSVGRSSLAPSDGVSVGYDGQQTAGLDDATLGLYYPLTDCINQIRIG